MQSCPIWSISPDSRKQGLRQLAYPIQPNDVVQWSRTGFPFRTTRTMTMIWLLGGFLLAEMVFWYLDHQQRLIHNHRLYEALVRRAREEEGYGPLS